MKWTRPLDWFIALFSPTMRSALELGRLNEIWESYNDGLLSSHETIKKVYSQRWQYHLDKVSLLVKFAKLKHEAERRGLLRGNGINYERISQN